MTDISTEDESTLERTVHSLHIEAMRYGLVMNVNKTKTMVFGDKHILSKICIDGIELENVEKFIYPVSYTHLTLPTNREV